MSGPSINIRYVSCKISTFLKNLIINKSKRYSLLRKCKRIGRREYFVLFFPDLCCIVVVVVVLQKRWPLRLINELSALATTHFCLQLQFSVKKYPCMKRGATIILATALNTHTQIRTLRYEYNTAINASRASYLVTSNL